MKALYQNKPGAISYMPLPDGRADVWLRENVTETTDEEGNACWECDEVSFRTYLSEEEVTVNFDTIFANGGVTVDEDTEEEVADGVTLKERVEALEESQLETLTLLADLLG